jgi:NAD(P)-dependent dehydrogenase (short-subunit alcohol dehydrogenase family)
MIQDWAQATMLSGHSIAITGAAQGLGRTYAETFAACGARLVLADVDGAALAAAAAAVEALGARVVTVVGDAREESAATGLVAAALGEFGRLDALVVNAGYLRDRSFANMSTEEFDDIVAVHLRGAFLACRAAWPTMKVQGFGRIVLTTSTSALFGQFGQANYDAAKLGVVGLMNALKQEGPRYGIHVNTVAPLAATRLSTVFPPEALALMDPRWVAAVTAHLCSAQCRQSGLILQVGAGRVARMRIAETAATMLDEDVLTEPARAAAAIEHLLATEGSVAHAQVAFFETAPEAVTVALSSPPARQPAAGSEDPTPKK